MTASSKRPHTRASAAIRRSQSRASSLAPSIASSAASSSLSNLVASSAAATPRAARAGRTAAAAARAVSVSHIGHDEREDSTAGGDGMTDDDVEALESRGILLKTESHAVSVLGGIAALPAEVARVLEDSDFYTDPYSALIDHETGYACLVGKQRCYAWSIQQQASSTSSPTCYIFPVPAAPSSSTSGLNLVASVFSPVPFCAFVPQGGSAREPGFLLVTTAGQMQFWSSISQALSNVERTSASSSAVATSIAPGEVVRAQHKLTHTHYILGTSGARLFSVQVLAASSGSQAHIQVSLLSRSRGMLARVGGLFGGASADPRAGILAVTSARAPSDGSRGKGRDEGSVVFAVQDRAVQSWRVSDATEQFIGEMDVYELLRETLFDLLDLPPSQMLQPEIVDAKATSADTVLLLVSFLSIREQHKSTRTGRTEYALVALGSGFTVEHSKLLSYSHEPNPTPLCAPKLFVSSADTELAFIVFPEVVCLVTTQASHLEEEIALRNSIKDRLIGAGQQDATTLTLLAASSGLLQLEVAQTYLHTQNQRAESQALQAQDSEAAATQRLKSKFDQAVVFGDRVRNPLAFELRLDDAGDLVQAAEAVSREILSSSSPHLPNIIDLRAQLADRASRLRLLITFIQDNTLINRLSKTSKRHLSWDAEKLNASIGLWARHNSRIAEARKNGSMQNGAHDVLSEAIESAALLGVAQSFAEDPTRSFFRTQVGQLGRALEALLPILRRETDPSSRDASLASRTLTTQHVAEILSITYRSVLRFRAESSNLYAITNSDQTCLSEPWTSRSTSLSLLRLTVERLEQVIRERSRELGSNVDNEDLIEYGRADEGGLCGSREVREREERHTQKSLKEHFAELSDYALAMHRERMAYLESLGDEPAAVSELRDLLSVYVQLRANVIASLAQLARTNVAYDLAERYRDFKSLVLLCEDAQTGSPIRVQFYIEKYGEKFAFSLYQFYLENNRLHDLMTQDRAYQSMLSRFLKMSKIPRLAWIQDVATKRYEDASVALLTEAARETQLAEQKLMLSIGKLAKVAALTRSQLDQSEAAQRALEAIDDRLDVVTSHDRLVEMCRGVLDARDLAKPVEVQARRCAERLCAGNAEAPKQLTTSLFEALLMGRALSTEDLADLLSVKDNEANEQAHDFAHALELLSRDRSTPQARMALAARTVWRRVYMRDDWAALRQSAASASDDALATSLRSSALFATLLSCYSKPPQEQVSIVRPAQALFGSTPEEEDALRARFSADTADGLYGKVSLDKVVAEYASESQKLREYVEGQSVKLEQFFDEVERLVGVEMQQQQQQNQEAYGQDDTLMMDESVA